MRREILAIISSMPPLPPLFIPINFTMDKKMNAISICNAALMKLGASPIVGFDDSSPESMVVAKLYPVIKQGLLSSHIWGFATRTTILAPLNVTQVNGDKNNNMAPYRHQLPVDFLRVINVFTRHLGENSTIRYEIHERAIVSQYADIMLKYIADIDDKNLPPFFVQPLVARLAAEFCMPITDSTTRMQALYNIATKELQKARGIDAQQETPAILSSQILLEGRG